MNSDSKLLMEFLECLALVSVGAQLGKHSVNAQRDGPYIWGVWVDGRKQGEMLSEIRIEFWVDLCGAMSWTDGPCGSLPAEGILWFHDPFFPGFKWECM